jgi:small-conductance mechanosensitive channel
MTMNKLMEMLGSFLDPHHIWGAVFLAIVFFSAATIVARLIRLWTKKLSRHPGLFIDQTSGSFVGKLLELLIFLIAAIMYAHTIPALKNLGTALLASASVLSIVLGLAAQSALSNLMAGIALLLYKPFRIGDVLTILSANCRETGKVQEFSLGYTKLLTEDGRLVMAPNSIVMASVIVRNK